MDPDQLVGPLQILGLVVMQPGDLVDRGRDIWLEAGQSVDRLGPEPAHLLGGGSVQPQDAWT